MSGMRKYGAAVVVVAIACALACGAASGAAKSTAGSSPRSAGKRAVAETVMVRIGTEKITPATVQARLDELPDQVRSQFSNPEGRQRLLERLVEEKVWLLASLKHGVAARPEVQRQLESQRRDLLIRTYVNELMAQSAQPSDSEAKVYYEEHKTDYRMPATATISHIQLKTESEAKRVKQLAKSKSSDWKALATKYSTDSLTRVGGGSLGMVTHEGVFGSLGSQPALAESAFALGEGKIGGPYRTEKGWHVIKVDAVKAETVRPFEQVRGGIVRQLASKRTNDFYQTKLAETRAELRVRVDSAAIKSFISVKKTPRDLFNEAQAAGPAPSRIEAYRQVVRDYPASDVAPQAQFMIGFIYSEELKDFTQAESAFKDLIAMYPKSELVSSAQWMIEHMRTEGAPAFMNLEADSGQKTPVKHNAKGPSGKP